MLLIECLKSFTAKTENHQPLDRIAFCRGIWPMPKKFTPQICATGISNRLDPTIATPTLGRGDSHGFSANVATHCNPRLPPGGQGRERSHATRFLPTRENRLAGSRRNQERTL